MSKRETGSVLVQVLALVALASAIAVMMHTVQDRAISVTARLRDREQAEALARSGETSLLVAFRRDLVAGPGADHYGEAWYAVAQDEIQLPAGRFSLAIEDAQARFNINRLGSGLAESASFDRIALAVGAGADAGTRISAALILHGELASMDDLTGFGFSAGEIEALSALVTVLPGRAGVNMNTADARLVRILMVNPASASRLLARRDQAGALDAAGLGQIGILLPPGTGIETDFIEVHVEAQVGSETAHLNSLIARTNSGGAAEAVVIRRTFTQE